MRRNYWSCTKFADWIRGTPKGEAKTSEDWENWSNNAKANYSFRYWLAEEALDAIQNFILLPITKIYDIKYYINNRFITRTHCLSASTDDIKPGSWCDVGNRFLPCLFNELVEFVEVELAWWHIAWDDEAKEKYKAPFYAKGWFRWRIWRCREAGLDNLAWQMSLKHDEDYCKDEPYYGEFTPQAIRAKEIFDLYNWWTIKRPARRDPYEASGFSAHCAKMRSKYGGSFNQPKDIQEKTEGDLAHTMLTMLEEKYEAEDEEMLIRLIKIRQARWT
jgi:hypothetical protein